ncbi:ABC transporter ATP-binding protein [Crenobacter cavernae]|uniref:ABC transporter ATP-binding protein n=1 Tax=Crenobacter cavernae TaxID=2290923 RepID=A0ABY0FFJ9_9NEIS|nr:ABC transporter ATP-binding protein [Crenobacter cavernae]RXZ45093.1 ABC transporter ATP-binding protein [Crenobacter cavernae]
MPAAVEFIDACRHYGPVRAVDGLDLAIEEGEFFSLLGPSGSGKTTCLRLIAGFELPTRGRVLIHGEDASHKPPYQRDVNTVFQDYALFPFMTVLDNVAYGLRVKGVARHEREKQARDALDMVALADYGGRKPGQLSGGQRQRVALARALVNRPRVLLLDEPLGALDLKLREQMQVELKRLQKRLAITFVFVTHDQGEALSMSDRVAVFADGRLEQVDTPQALYARPASRFVADFVGTSNVIEPTLAERLAGRAQAFSIRPERVTLARVLSDGEGQIRVSGTLVDVQFLGAQQRFEVEVDGGATLTAILPAEDGPARAEPGEAVTLSWPASAMHWLER